MALKFRRGTTAQQSGSLAFGEPYVNTSLGTLVVGGQSGDIVLSTSGTGSTGNFGAISGSGLDITGNANIAGNLTLGGQLTIGDATSDTVNVVASLSSSLIPSNNNTFDLGSPTKIWRDLYISTGSIKMYDAAGNLISTLSATADGMKISGELSASTVNGLGSPSAFSSSVVSKFNTLGSYTGSVDTRLTEIGVVTGSLNTSVSNLNSFTSSINTTIKSKLDADGIVSSSAQINSQINFLNVTSSIVPSVANTFDLGSPSKQWRDLYLSSASLYIDGIPVLSSTAAEIVISSATGQSIKLNELGTDDIILQTLDGNIEFKSSGGGDILLDPTDGVVSVRGTLQVQDSHKITSSGGTKVTFGNDLVVSGSITSTGNINGLNINSFSSSVDSRISTEKGRVDAILSASSADKDSFAEIVELINSVDTTNDNAFASFYTASVGRLNNLESTSASVNTSVSNINTTTASLNTSVSNLNSTTASVNVSVSNLNSTTASLNTSVGNLNTFSSSALTRLSALETETSNLESFTSSINTTIKSKLDADGVISSSAQLTTTFDSRYLNTGGDGVVSGSAQIDVASTTGDIALGTRTSGNYVATITAGTGVSSTGATTGEGIAHTISIGQAVSTTSNVQFGSIGVGMAASGTSGRIDAANDVVAFSTSDIRFKENITPIPNAIEKIRKISGNTYDWKAELKDVHGYEGNDVGVIAQEVEEVLPQLVQNRDNGYKAVKYDKLVALLIEGIKEQQQHIDNLTIQVEELKKQKGL